jgi:hypothetical protein
MVVLAGARVGATGAEVAGGSEGLDAGNVWDRDEFSGDGELDLRDLTDAADRDGPR